MPYGVNSETGESTGVIHRCEKGFEEWKKKQRELDKLRTGRSETKACMRCGKKIYWSYERRSQNDAPLPIDEETDELHKCPYYKPNI